MPILGAFVRPSVRLASTKKKKECTKKSKNYMCRSWMHSFVRSSVRPSSLNKKKEGIHKKEKHWIWSLNRPSVLPRKKIRISKRTNKMYMLRPAGLLFQEKKSIGKKGSISFEEKKKKKMQPIIPDYTTVAFFPLCFSMTKSIESVSINSVHGPIVSFDRPCPSWQLWRCSLGRSNGAG